MKNFNPTQLFSRAFFNQTLQNDLFVVIKEKGKILPSRFLTKNMNLKWI